MLTKYYEVCVKMEAVCIGYIKTVLKSSGALCEFDGNYFKTHAYEQNGSVAVPYLIYTLLLF